MDDNGQDSDGEFDTDISFIEETAKDVPDSGPDKLQDHTSSSEFDEKPDDTSLQVKNSDLKGTRDIIKQNGIFAFFH